jgi:uncharacterized protein (DUF849 family)
MVAPNGARRGKADHPGLPVTPAEVAATAIDCSVVGAAAIHLHARDAAGAHTLSPEICRHYLDDLEAVAPGRIEVQLTTEAVGRYVLAEQMELVRSLKPEAVSLALRELLPEPEAEPVFADFLAELARAEISPQYILYTPAEVRAFEELRRRGIIAQTAPFSLFVLGRYVEAGHVTRPADLLEFVTEHDPDCPWAVCAFGRTETAVLALAASLGGHLRVGFENNLEHADGTLATSNAERVAAVAALVRGIGREVATAEQAREILQAAAA